MIKLPMKDYILFINPILIHGECYFTSLYPMCRLSDDELLYVMSNDCVTNGDIYMIDDNNEYKYTYSYDVIANPENYKCLLNMKYLIPVINGMLPDDCHICKIIIDTIIRVFNMNIFILFR